MQNFITTNSTQTKKLGEMLSQELCGGEVICLVGELGSGKTTFTQGLLKGLRVKGPYTSPTFLIMKKYEDCYKLKATSYKPKAIYHFDTYRVSSQDILDLGFEEIIADKKNVTIVEWADKICDIIPAHSLWINFEWIDKKKRKISFTTK